MAKFDLKFLDCTDSSTIQVECVEINNPNQDVISIELYDCISEEVSLIYLDKSTAIKFAKTLRTEINKMTEQEGGLNGGR